MMALLRVSMVLSLVATAFALSGCIGTAAATAVEAQKAAQSKAQAWNPNAQLAGIMGIEGTFNMGWMAGYMMSMSTQGDHASASAHFEASDEDKKVGDGRCLVWAYRWVAPGVPGYYMVVEKEKKVVFEGYVENPSDAAVPLGDFKVDSDDALRIAKEANEGFRRGVESEHFGLVERLNKDAGHEHPEWIVAGGGGSSQGAGGGMVRIDAVTGLVLENQGGFMTPPSGFSYPTSAP